MKRSPVTAFPPARRRLRLGFVGGGRGAFIGEVHAMGARLSNRWEVVAGALSSDPAIALQSGRDWLISEDRIYGDYHEMARCEAARPDGIDAVAIVTPNHTHREIAETFFDAGIDVICDKPIATSLADARALQRRQRETGLVFGVTHPYAAYAMVHQARQMIAAGAIGSIRQIHVEYLQGFAMTPPDPSRKGHQWRLDPAIVGPSSTAADIGTHAHHLASFVSGLRMTTVSAEFHVCGAAKPLEDTAFMRVRFQGDVPGTLMVSQAAVGNSCALRLRVYGTQGGIEWEQETPEYLQFTPIDGARQTISRGMGMGVLSGVAPFVHMPRGHPEALTDAWSNLYTELAVAIAARRDGGPAPEGILSFADVDEGVRGVAFVEAAVASNRAGGAWIDLETSSPS
jgi:predicted dehydrogenase